MRIQQRTDDILNNDNQPDPRREAGFTEQQEMKIPHRIEHDASKHAPLQGNVQGLIVRIGDRIGPGAGLADGFPVEQLLGRPGAMAKQGSFANGSDRYAPVLQPLAGRGRFKYLGVFPVFEPNAFDTLAQVG